ncbi:MAG TPA: hypothetical protein VFT34_18755 [Verrucomicrobiae bacterium]|nr:hypothetical protein [Verrucomicrobiae bacterium]
MPGPIVHVGATVLCMHAGTALPVAPFPRVLVSGQPIVTQACAYTVAGCSLASTSSPPCVTAQWVLAALRVQAGGVPVVVVGSQAACVPTGTGLMVVVAQPRVIAT